MSPKRRQHDSISVKWKPVFFFVADHLLVGQLCTNPKSDRSLLLCLKVTQCSTSKIGDSPLYNSCTLPIHVMTTGPLPAPSKCKSGLPRITGTCPGGWKQSVYLDVLKSVVIPWCNPVAGGRPRVWPQDLALAHKSKETEAWLLKECYNFVPFLHWPPSSPDLNPLDYFIWSYVENITNMTSHNIKASLIATIRWVFAELPPALVEKACSQFWIHIEAVIEAEGSYIE